MHLIENNMLAYAGQTPWHGLGVPVKDGTSGQKMLELAKMDWEVETRPLSVRDNSSQNWLTLPIKDYRAVVRNTDDKVFQIVGTGYEPIQNQEIVDFFSEFCDAGEASMETVGALRDGAVVWALAKLNGGDATLKGKDELKGYLLLASSHDGSLATIGQPTQVRVVCWNTLSLALKNKAHSFKMRHTRKFDAVEQKRAKQVMRMSVEKIEEANEIASILSKVKIDDKGRNEFISKLLNTVNVSSSNLDANPEEKIQTRTGVKILDAMINSPGSDLPSAKNTLWGAVNGVTYWADHSSQSGSQSQRLYSSWFGAKDKRKEDAVKIALEMAR